MKLRPANLGDSELLLQWRNDPITRQFSLKVGVVEQSEHEKWLRGSLANPQRRIYIAEIEGHPVGTIRTDFDGEFYELSWTVAPERRGQGVGKELVSTLVKLLAQPTRATIKKENLASIRIAEQAGLIFEGEKDGTLCFTRR